MRFRAIVATSVAAAALSMFGWTASPAAASTICTWGGTALEPTGTFTIRPGLTGTPAPEPLDFRATGVLGGGPGCAGSVTFIGIFHAGSSCNTTQSWEGRVKGLPGATRFEGAGTILSNSFMYDRAGNLVASEQAQIHTLPGDSQLLDCNTPEGFTHGHFNSVMEIY
jgi:hypothetical protein